MPGNGISLGKGFSRFVVPTLVVLIGVALRFLVMRRGHNFDFDSYRIVVEIMSRGGNVYAETERYNYGPVWFLLLDAMERIAQALRQPELFRYLLVSLLTLADLGIFAILYRKFSPRVAYLFLLNPISIIITGFHNQFDNLAVLIGMAGTLAYGDPESRKPLPKLAGLLLIALSLITKHFLFIFPFWIAVREKGLFWKALSLVLPPALFLYSFLPYWGRGHNGIMQNVFMYRSFDNAPFYRVFIPEFFHDVVSTFNVMLLALVVGAFAFRKKPLTESLLLYSWLLVLCAPAVTNQYLAIAVPAISLYFNPFAIVYTGLGTALLVSDVSGLNIAAAKNVMPMWLKQEYVRLAVYKPIIAALFFTFVVAFFPEPIRRAIKRLGAWAWEEIREQGRSLRSSF